MNVFVKSASLAEQYARTANDTECVAISISSHAGVPATIIPNNTNKIKEVLFLSFDDTDRETEGAIQPSDGLAIKSFLERVIPQYSVDSIMVNCEAGQSRSAGVAAAIMNYFNHDDSPIFDCYKYTPNMRCYRTVLNALYGD